MATHSKTRTAVQRLRRAARRAPCAGAAACASGYRSFPARQDTTSRWMQRVDSGHRVAAETPGIRPKGMSHPLEAARSGS